MDSRHFYEILVPGFEVWQKEHIIHTQNNCIKIALRVWLPLTKPRKLRNGAKPVLNSPPQPDLGWPKPLRVKIRSPGGRRRHAGEIQDSPGEQKVREEKDLEEGPLTEPRVPGPSLPHGTCTVMQAGSTGPRSHS